MLNVNELLIYKIHSQHKIPFGGICGPWSNDLVIFGVNHLGVLANCMQTCPEKGGSVNSRHRGHTGITMCKPRPVGLARHSRCVEVMWHTDAGAPEVDV